ncbi:hypothetical protein [Motilibacter deserti]|uniref:Subunit length determinant protein n=1 Tax=Motilibacter deserti TaxID=2714956 RepID=A0ABX0GUD8_9ACTN|nr:hypothetical protein [Motilibacter deserti]NHC14392.1 hypothetical protein [Motilibacter deserti]
MLAPPGFVHRRRYSRRLRVSVASVAILVVLGAGAAFTAAAAHAPRYTAISSVLLRDYQLGGAPLADERAALRFHTNAAFIARSRPVLEGVAVRIGRPRADWARLREDLAVTSREDADVLDLWASARTAASATRLADAVASELTDRLRGQFKAVPPGLSAEGRRRFEDLRDLERVSPAAEVLVSEPPADRVSIEPWRAGLAGGVAGLVAGLLVLAWRFRRRDELSRFPAAGDDAARPASS